MREAPERLSRLARVAALRAAGWRPIEIAVELGISKRTVQRELRELAGLPRWGGD